MLLSGGLTAGKVGTDVAGSLAHAYTEDWTGSPIAGALADLLVQHKLDKAATSFKDILKKTNAPEEISKIKNPKIEKHISEMYKKSDELGSTISARPEVAFMRKKLVDISERAADEPLTQFFDKTAQRRIQSNINKVEDLLYKDKLNLTDLAQQEKIFNKHFNPKNSIEDKYFKDIKNVFTNGLEQAAEKHPEWGKYYNNSKNLYKVDKWQSNLGEWAEEYSKKGLLEKLVPNKSAQGILGGLLYYGLGSKAGLGIPLVAPIAKAGAAKIAGSANKVAQGSKFAAELTKTPEGLKVLTDIIESSAKKNYPLLKSNLKKLNKIADSYNESDFEEFNPEEWEPV